MTGYLLDTNAVCEPDRPRPNGSFMEWFDSVPEEDMYLSVVVEGELFKGIFLQKDVDSRRKLRRRTVEIISAFETRVLDIDSDSAKLWGSLIAAAQKKGHPAPILDCFLAAQVIRHNLTLVTRNTKDFEQFEGLEKINPWQDKF